MLVCSAKPHELEFQVSLLYPGGVGGGVGGWGKLELMLTQPPAGVGAWAELGNSENEFKDQAEESKRIQNQIPQIPIILLILGYK